VGRAGDGADPGAPVAVPAAAGGPDMAVAARAAAAAQVFVADLDGLELSAPDSHHLGRVLRLRPGEPVVAADGQGRWRLCSFRGSARSAGAGAGDRGRADPVLEAAGPVCTEPRPEPAVTVAFAPAKGERHEWVVQKLTELGVDRMVPLATDRSVVRWQGDRARHAVARLRRVAKEAAAQCRRVWLPEVAEVATVADLVAGEVRSGGPPALAQLGGMSPWPALRTVAVGPEGGWSPAELAMGLPRVGLADNVLRSETAAVAAGVLLGWLRAGLRDPTVRPGTVVPGTVTGT